MDVKTACLGILSLGDATGYEIKKQFEDGPFSHFFQAGFGSIYPALNALSAEGLIGRADTDTDGRMDRKVYAITAVGKAALRRNLAEQNPADKIRCESLVMLSFAECMTEARRAEVFDAYVEEYRERAQRLEETGDWDDASHRGVIVGLGKAIYATIADYMAENRERFLDAAAEAAGEREDTSRAAEPRTDAAE